MDFISFPEANRNLGAPAGMSPEECGTLPVYADGQQSISCWQPTQQEREAIAAGLPVYLGVLVSTGQGERVYTQPPVFVTVAKPEMPAVVHELSPKMVAALKFIASLLPVPDTMGAGLRDGADLAIEQPELRGPDGQPLEAGKQYYVSGTTAWGEHYANLVQAYELNGQPGVVAYLQPYEAFLPKEVFTA